MVVVCNNGIILCFIVSGSVILSPWEKWMVKKAKQDLERKERLRKEMVCTHTCIL